MEDVMQMTIEERRDFDRLCSVVLEVEVGSPYYDVLVRHRERDDDANQIDTEEALNAMLQTITGPAREKITNMDLPEGIKEQFRAESVGAISITASGGITGEWVDTYEQALNDGAEFVTSGAWTQFEVNKVYVAANLADSASGS